MSIKSKIKRWVHNLASSSISSSKPSEHFAVERLSRNPGKAKIIILAFFNPEGLSTIVENINLLAEFSENEFHLLNLYNHPHPDGFALPENFSFDSFDGIFIHSTVSYDPTTLKKLDRFTKAKIKSFHGIKILMKQDEQVRTNETLDLILEHGYNLVLTCVPEKELHKVYPARKFSNTIFFPVLTGYVSPQMRSLNYPPLAERVFDVGYRGSIQPLYFGRLALEKKEIGESFTARSVGTGLKLNISSQWEDRINGSAWFDFLGSCKAVLGVESGASFFDFTGEFQSRVSQYLEKHPEADFQELEDKFFKNVNGNVYYNQVSPRHFEAAACRAIQILYEGQYSDIFIPGRHYLSLKKDFSNFDEILKTLKDIPKIQSIADQCYEEVIMNPKYWYETYVGELDKRIGLCRTR